MELPVLMELVLGNTPWQVSVNSNSAYYPFDNIHAKRVRFLLSRDWETKTWNGKKQNS